MEKEKLIANVVEIMFDVVNGAKDFIESAEMKIKEGWFVGIDNYRVEDWLKIMKEQVEKMEKMVRFLDSSVRKKGITKLE